MQLFKSALVVSSVVFVAAMAANGCSSGNKGTGDAGEGGIIPTDGSKLDKVVVQPDGGGSCPSSDPACEVCDVSSFEPLAQGAPVAGAAQCAPADITAFVTKCLSGTTGSPTDCQAWQTAEQTSAPNCLACTFTEQTAASWGLLICTSAGCSINIPGCLDLALGQVSQESTTSTPKSCGDFLSASYGCQDAACSSCSTTDFPTCSNDAVAAECKTYADGFTNASTCSSLQGDAIPTKPGECFPASQTGYSDAEFNKLTNIFCGTGF